MENQDNMKHIVIVLPTYNERGNIAQLLESIQKQRAYLSGVKLSMLIVDDSSPDGTGEIVKYFSSNDPNIHLLNGMAKRGLGVAYVRGIKHAISKLHADIIFQMDSDLSHDPDDIPRLLNEVLNGNDFVIGSRYIWGGSVPKNWSRLRKYNSKWGNIFARHVAGLKNISDCTSGYRAINTNIFNKINLNKLGAKGYSVIMNLLYQAVKNEARVKEIPIHFSERAYGKSKIRLVDVLEFIKNAFYIRFTFLNFLAYLSILTLISAAFGFISLFAIYGLITFKLLIAIFLTVFSILLTIQSSFSIFWMLYAWEDVERVEKDKSPTEYILPKNSFTAIVPARHEVGVISDTIKAISNINYPELLKETLIICRFDDTATIAKAQKTIEELGKSNIRLIISESNAVNKPHSLNTGLENATKDTIVIFDAEDQPSPQIYNIANTVMVRRKVDVLQSGVQLINFRSSWFSALNVLEYYFWFKSALHFFASKKIVLLGGNTVFFKKEWLEEIEGWDESCLTEDADMGIRLSVAGAKMGVVYDELHTTQEETPPNLASFIRQRTRWNQGFLQILLKGDWLNLPNLSQRLLAGYILILPEVQAFLFLFVPVSIFIAVMLKLPVLVTLLSLLPLLLLILQLTIYNIGLYEFTKDYKQKYPLWFSLKVLYVFYPFQIILGLSSLRAISRLIRGKDSWEKTKHVNAHRENFDLNLPASQIALNN